MIVICSGSNVKGEYVPCGRLIAIVCDKCGKRTPVKSPVTIPMLGFEWMREFVHVNCGGSFVPLDGPPEVSHGLCPVCLAAGMAEVDEMIQKEQPA